MRCPYCEFDNTKVTDSRDSDDGIRRRRECLACGQRFTTIERIAAGELLVAKKDGRREPFGREKLLAGMRKACEKRPLPAGTVEAVADAIESRSPPARRPRSDERQTWASWSWTTCATLDHIAYIRFASVYREFADLEELQAELESLAANPRGEWRRTSIAPARGRAESAHARDSPVPQRQGESEPPAAIVNPHHVSPRCEEAR